MGDLILVLFLCGLSFWLGRITAPKKPQKPEVKPRARTYTFNERQRLKVMYATDADRIRELNALSKNESAFLRLLRQEFSPNDVIVKQKRFFYCGY